MSSTAVRLARPEILELPPIDVGPYVTDAALRGAIKLHLNENPFAPLTGGPLSNEVNRYPHPQPPELRRVLAALYGVRVDQLVVTRGADDAIDVLVRTFCRPGEDAVSLCQPTFTAYAHFAQVQGARVIETRLDPNFDFIAEDFLSAVKDERSLKLAFVCSPNNPTGNVVAPADILRVADALPDTIIVADEAYIEFADVESLAAEAAARENLVVLRTLSKAYGLAGARIGCAIGNAELIGLLARVLPPFPIPSLASEAALLTLAPSRRPLHRERIARIKAERERVAGLLNGAPGVRSVRNGAANFLFVDVDDPAALQRKLEALEIRVRFRPNIVPGGLRLTIGTPEENGLALSAFGIDDGAVRTRRAEAVRDTKETRIAVAVDLDRAEPRQIDTGVPFFDHMLDQIAAHAGFSLVLACEGDLEIDPHHSLEDCALAVGQALAGALGERRGIGRFGFSLPMDETEAHVLIDLSGRPYSRFEGSFAGSHIGAYPTEMTPHIFRSLATSLGAAIHVRVDGENDHHKTEACFKAFGRALRPAIALEGAATVPSTKGAL